MGFTAVGTAYFQAGMYNEAIHIFFFVGCWDSSGALVNPWNGKRIWKKKDSNVILPSSTDSSPGYKQDGVISIGMTEEQVMDSLGYPNGGKNRSVGAWGNHEQWVYRPDSMRDRYHTKYLYFENGILTSWQY